MEVLDCFTFNDELEVIDIRFHTLDKYISKFIIVESNNSQTGYEVDAQRNEAVNNYLISINL